MAANSKRQPARDPDAANSGSVRVAATATSPGVAQDNVRSAAVDTGVASVLNNTGYVAPHL
jgi:hypothetical protein